MSSFSTSSTSLESRSSIKDGNDKFTNNSNDTYTKKQKIPQEQRQRQRQQQQKHQRRTLGTDVFHFESIGERRKRKHSQHDASSRLNYKCPICEKILNRAKVSDSQINHHIAKCLDSPPPHSSSSSSSSDHSITISNTLTASMPLNKIKTTTTDASPIISNNTLILPIIRCNKDIPSKHQNDHRLHIQHNKISPILLHYMNQRASNLLQNKSSYVLNTHIKSVVIGENILDAFPPNLGLLSDDFISSFFSHDDDNYNHDKHYDDTSKTKKEKNDKHPKNRNKRSSESSLFFSCVLSKIKHLYLTFLETDTTTTKKKTTTTTTTTKTSSSLMPSSPSSEPPQLPHIDYKWSTINRYFTTQSNSNDNEVILPWIAFFPLTKAGMRLNVWLEEGLPHKLELNLGDVAFLRGDVVHSGGFSGVDKSNGHDDDIADDNNDDGSIDGRSSGNRRCHVFLPLSIADIPMGNEYFEKEDDRVLLSERYIIP